MRDLGLCPIIRNQDILLNADYRVEFAPDTTYMIMRKMLGSSIFTDTLKKGLKYVNYKPTVDDSSRTYDGIFFNVLKLRYNTATWNGNVGVVRDPVLPSDSVQTKRYGWEYNPGQNRFVTGADSCFVNNAVAKFQSTSMSLTYPTTFTFNAKGSKVAPNGLRVVKIKYTGYGNGQRAYRYLGHSGDTLGDPSIFRLML